MKEYHKIQSLFKRDEKTHKFIVGEYSLPEFYYLRDNEWTMTEKIDGTNIRIGWIPEIGKKFGGRTDNAQTPTFLLDKLQYLFPDKLLSDVFPSTEVSLYGEGYGAKIQKGGGNYIPDGCDFILFDVMIGGWWLERENVEDIARKLHINVVPIIMRGTIHDAIMAIHGGVGSTFGDFLAEGMVLKPTTELFTRNGKRIVTKIKHRDF